MFARYATLALALSISPVATAQEWPAAKPVHILIGFGAGGGTDVATRYLSRAPFGALGAIRGREQAGRRRLDCRRHRREGAEGRLQPRGAGDGTFRLGGDGQELCRYDPVNDFAPVAIFTNSAFVIVVPKNSPATDIKSLIEHVNKQPGTLNYSTVGLGSTQHLVAEHLRQRTGMKAQAVSYRTTGEVVTALLRDDAAFAVELYHRNTKPGGSRRIAAAGGGNAKAVAGHRKCAHPR